MAAKFELKKAPNGQYLFNLKAGNGEVILSSELYEGKAGARNGIDSVRKNASDRDRYERKTSKDGRPFFLLIAANGQVIGRSEMYESMKAMENGIASVTKNAPKSRIEDLA